MLEYVGNGRVGVKGRELVVKSAKSVVNSPKSVVSITAVYFCYFIQLVMLK